MSGLFEIFNIAKRGMFAQQTALHVTGHNVSNANTDGYSVQRANLKTTEPFGMPSISSAAEPGQLGTGVEVESITRQRDEFLDGQVRKEKGTLGRFDAKEQFLSEIESILMEPSETGISKTMTNFWDAWSQLSNNPEPNSTARTIVQQNAESLAKAINHTYSQLGDLETNAGELMRQQIYEVNSLMKQITEVNTQIKAVVIGGETPNDLMDKRDLLLDKLSNRFGFDVDKTNFEGVLVRAKVTDNNGSVVKKQILSDGLISQGVAYVNKIYKDGTKTKMEIYIDGDPNKNTEIDITGKESDYANTHAVLYNKDSFQKGTLDTNYVKPANFDSGSLNGYESIKSNVAAYKQELNNLAKVLAISVNTIHTNNDANNLNFFDPSAETETEAAKYLKVNDAIMKDSKLINAGKVIGSDTKEGNGERALIINKLRYIRLDINKIVTSVDPSDVTKARQAFADDVNLKLYVATNPANDNEMSLTSDSNGMTLDNYFKSTVTDLGVINQDAKRNVTNQESLLQQLETRKESISGVSLDEEITNMIQFSKSYQANAKMISVIDELLDVVVNGLKR